MNIVFVDMHPYGRTYLVESLDSGCARVDCEHIVFLVEYDLEYVGVSAYEDVRHVGVDELECFIIISSWISSYMHHEYFAAAAGEIAGVGYPQPYLVAVAVAVNAFEGLECRYLQQCLLVSEVPCVPYLVHRVQEFAERVVEAAVSV